MWITIKKLQEVGYIGKNWGQGKLDCRNGSLFDGLFHAAKIELCYTIDKYGILNDNKKFGGHHDTERLPENFRFFKLRDGESVIRKLPCPWKRSFARGLTIGKKETIIKESMSNLNEIKRLPPDELGNMLPHYVERKQMFW